MKKIISCILCGILTVGLMGCSLFDNGKPTVQTKIYEASDSTDRYEDYIFVGDSRFVGMKDALGGHVDSDVEIIAKVGQGLAWLKKTAPSLYDKTGKTIIFNLGVNDLYNASLYVEYYNNMPKSFLENNRVIFMTVNPVNEKKEAEYGYKVTNKEIEKFNNTLKENLDKNFLMIDTNTYAQLNDFTTTDGLHYNNKTYIGIFDHAIECCENNDFVKR